MKRLLCVCLMVTLFAAVCLAGYVSRVENNALVPYAYGEDAPDEEDEGDPVPMDDYPEEFADGDLEEETVEARDLTSGDSGDDVAELQARLQELNYYDGELTGSYGARTKQAVSDFQDDFELDVTGDADAQTQAMLYAAMYRPLRYGSYGSDVEKLQTRLMALGFYRERISGNYLESTVEAVSAFQEKNRLDVTGNADIGTQEVLFSGKAVNRDDVSVPTATPAPASFLVDENAPAASVDTENVAFTKKLKNGSTGAVVKQLQTRLTELGYYTGPVSGNFLGKTTKAVKTLQTQNGIKADGVVDETTWNLIFNDNYLVGPSDTPKPTATPEPVPFAITIDVNNQVTTVYGRDANGEYTVIVRQMLCSTGTVKNPSPTGEFVLSGRHAQWCKFPQYGSYARYWTKINSSIAFHSVIYNSVSNTDMKTSSYEKLGRRASHGCIRLTVADAKWIFDNVGKGTVVTIRDDMPADPELRDSLKLAPLDYKKQVPKTTPQPTAEPEYRSNAQPPLPLKQLKKNASSEQVYWLQRKLTDLGYYQGKCSGTYLDGTVKAVKAFEKANGLYQDGVADVKMQELLYADVLNPGSQTPVPNTK